MVPLAVVKVNCARTTAGSSSTATRRQIRIRFRLFFIFRFPSLVHFFHSKSNPILFFTHPRAQLTFWQRLINTGLQPSDERTLAVRAVSTAWTGSLAAVVQETVETVSPPPRRQRRAEAGC